ncbi:MAG: 2-dehydro-3-deoxygalactonokinase [Ginsengibacter sp.]
MKRDYFLSVDWGTSNFRLRLVEKKSVQVVKEIVSPAGVKSFYSKWEEEGGDREYLFLNFLKSQINQLDYTVPEDIEIVISGMASSNIGIRELPYATLPFNINGDGLFIEVIKNSLFPFGVRLVSGVCSDSDIIRGEETQMLGLTGNENIYGKNIFILPGTHSKHIVCENGKITGFNTFMTGELFQVISTHSILKNSIEKPTSDFIDLGAFDEGVHNSQSNGSILKNLFKIRAWDVLGKSSARENYCFLSGLLIGQEMASLKSMPFDQIQLCAGNNLHEYYKRAIQKLELDERTVIIEKEHVENSVIRGQLKLLQQKISA